MTTWQGQAVAWLRGKAAEQAQNNERWPEHAKCYSSWTERVKTMRGLADELERDAEENQHPMAGLHINQGSFDAAADAYEAEYNKAHGIATPSIEDAYALGAKGGPVVEAERLAFEAWMRGHCWALKASWDGATYRGTAEHGNYICPHAIQIRQLWAAWRDRSALTPNAVLTGGEAVRLKT